jgi:EAL domain-containing protein (putative c-di-GMP-specific phosphodiesterase class I)
MDDFRKLPADVLKIDKSFLDSAYESERREVIIKSIFDIVKNI